MSTRRIIAIVVACTVGIALVIAWMCAQPRVMQHLDQKQYPPTMAPSQIWGN